MQITFFFNAQLYDRFASIFDEKVSSYGKERMSRDVSRLRRMNARLEASCVDRVARPSEAHAKEGPNAVNVVLSDPDKPWCLPYIRFQHAAQSVVSFGWSGLPGLMMMMMQPLAL